MNYCILTRRNRQLLILSLLLILTALFVLMVKPREAAASPIFSQKSGFYSDAFYLSIQVPEDCDVYYTLDSSNPTKDSMLYQAPIYIDNASLKENTYSMIPGMSAAPFAQAPDFLVDKCTVVRAIAIPKSGWTQQSSNIITESYFVGFSPDHFDGFPVISLVTDPDNLFDSKKGIYVGGELLEKYLQLAKDPEAEFWQYWPANYRIRGRDGEREAHVTFFDTAGNPIEQKSIGIRTQGNWSRAQVPRSLNFYARTEYDGQPFFSYDFFGNNIQLQTLTLSCGGNQFVTRINDYIVSERVRGLPYSVMNFQPYIMFLDGEYWGFYWLTEKYDSAYIRNTYGLEDSDVIMIKSQAVEEGYESDLLLYHQLLDFFATHDLSVPENYVQACELIDIESCMDYYATLIYLCRGWDWPNDNEALWRTREISDEPYADGKWRWMLFDCNSDGCMRQDLYDPHTLNTVIGESVIFGALWNNASFRAAFETRILEIADTCFQASDMLQFVDNYKQTMTVPLSKTWSRFYGRDNRMLGNYEESLERICTFFCDRREVVCSWFS